MIIQTMELPNGRFIIIMSGDGVPSTAEADFTHLTETTGAACVLVVDGPVEVVR